MKSNSSTRASVQTEMGEDRMNREMLLPLWGMFLGSNDRIGMGRTLVEGYIVHGVEHECVQFEKNGIEVRPIELVKFQREIHLGGRSLSLKRNEAESSCINYLVGLGIYVGHCYGDYKFKPYFVNHIMTCGLLLKC